jgi:uncharacterized protein YjbJ (UPF0337 family)
MRLRLTAPGASTGRPDLREDGAMSIVGKVKAKWDELLGRAEELYGESHGDAAAELHGEAVRLEGEAEEQAEQRADRAQESAEPPRHRDDDGLAGAR